MITGIVGDHVYTTPIFVNLNKEILKKKHVLSLFCPLPSGSLLFGNLSGGEEETSGC